MTIHVQGDFRDFFVVLLSSKYSALPHSGVCTGEARLTGTFRSGLFAVFVLVYMAIRDVQNAEVLRNEAQQAGMISLNCLVELILSADQRLADGSSREAKDCIVTTDLVAEWLQLNNSRRFWLEGLQLR